MESENRKFTVLSFITFSTLCAYILYLILTQVADWMKWGGSNALFGQPWMVVGGAAAGLFGLVLFIGLSTNQKALTFVDEVFLEVRRTTWPKGPDTAKSTIVVSIMIAVAALVLFAVDWVWGVFFNIIL